MSDDLTPFIFMLAVMALILLHGMCAIVAMNIYESKKRKGGAVWGLLFGVLGVLIAWLIVRKQDKKDK